MQKADDREIPAAGSGVPGAWRRLTMTVAGRLLGSRERRRSLTALCFGLFAACGAGDGVSTPDQTASDGSANDGSVTDASPATDGAPTTDASPPIAVTIEYSSALCGDIDGYRSSRLGGVWEPGRTFAVALPAVEDDIRVTAMEYSLQENAGGSAPLDTPHRAWLMAAQTATPPADGALVAWQVPSEPVGEAGNRRIRLEVPADREAVLAAGDTPFVVIELAPLALDGVETRSLDVDQCWVNPYPPDGYLFFAGNVAPPFTWKGELYMFDNWVPDVRVFGTVAPPR